ncbi:MAG: ATP-binding protein [Chloroflexota bacterium]
MGKSGRIPRSLPLQMITSFVFVIMFTALIIGIPAFLLIRGQLNRQAWTQVDQGTRAAQALYAAHQHKIESIADLTAQRPTLHEFILDENSEGLENYLHTLQVSAEIDWIIICDANKGDIMSTLPLKGMEPCQNWETSSMYWESGTTPNQAWIIGVSWIKKDDIPRIKVIVGTALDQEFTNQMHVETGLEHSIYANDKLISSSFAVGNAVQIETRPGAEFLEQRTFKVGVDSYYAASFALNGELKAEVALSILEIVDTQKQMIIILLGSILAVAISGSWLGVYIARRISNPLVQLTQAAEKFSQGDLETPVMASDQVQEVSRVARVLENARIDLQQTLTRLQNEQDWVSHLLESIVEGIMTLDPKCNISYFSQGAERITGWRTEDVLGKPCDQVFKLANPKERFSQFMPHPGERHKVIVILDDGRQATLAITGAHMAPSDASHAENILVFRDISEEEAINRLVGQFLANIVHEFRTPLSALSASIELLQDQVDDLTLEEVHELLGSLHLGILGLQTLIDNLLEGASIQAGHFRVAPQRVDLGIMISEAALTLHPLLEKYGQRLVVTLPAEIPVVNADSRRIVQVLVNLISNAHKFGPADEVINLSVLVDQEWARIKISDRGSGIPVESQEFLFYPFSHGSSSNAGAGLGLSVVKAIINAHGGQTGVENRPGGGAIFWFTLPIATGDLI